MIIFRPDVLVSVSYTTHCFSMIRRLGEANIDLIPRGTGHLTIKGIIQISHICYVSSVLKIKISLIDVKIKPGFSFFISKKSFKSFVKSIIKFVENILINIKRCFTNFSKIIFYCYNQISN